MIILAVISFFSALFASGLIVKYFRSNGENYSENKPQRFHFGVVPRLGGVAIFIGVIFACFLNIIFNFSQVSFSWNQWLILFFVAIVPAFFGGVYEDLTQRLSISYRLFLTLLTAMIGVFFLDLSVPRLGIAWLDVIFDNYAWIGIFIAIIAIAGLPHAFNIIDGYNGLAGMVSIIVCLAMTHVALQLGDRELATILVATIAATIGFLFWNYPSGQLFAGDSGAYIWGVIIAFCSIYLVQKHSTVSPWFPMLLLIYPVWETVFSIYRKLSRGDSPGMADALHLHQLIYRRLVRTVLDEDQVTRMLRRNNRTAPYLWAFTLFSVVPAVMFWNNSYVLMAGCLLFCMVYVAAYLIIIRFKLPSWLR
ncbi:MAG: glycosyltransferase [Comamonas sp.]|uniref:glycosyltransferase family 4 protein n=1 Tax=Comamonas sp. TaxID=34028 RepID=UPI002FCA1128